MDQGRLAGLDLAGLPRGSRGSVAGPWRQTPLPLALVRLGFRRAPGCLLPVCSSAHGCALAPVYLRCSLDARRSLVLVWHGFPLGSSREDVAAAGLRVVGPGRGASQRPPCGVMSICATTRFWVVSTTTVMGRSVRGAVTQGSSPVVSVATMSATSTRSP